MSQSHDLDNTVLARLRNEIGATAAQAAIACFCAEMPRRALLLKAASDAGDLPALRRLLHQIKGSALTFGATEVARIATAGDASARSGELASAIELAQQTATAIERTLCRNETP